MNLSIILSTTLKNMMKMSTTLIITAKSMVKKDITLSIITLEIPLSIMIRNIKRSVSIPVVIVMLVMIDISMSTKS